jgi:sulfur-carrier protein adenylyltransferase/sulfurtransferase
MTGFSYDDAFSRNIGWVTEREQRILRGKTVAIAGMGGVGGAHLLTLTRLGIGGFNIADFDVFEIANFNRQFGASMATIGKPKVDVLAEAAIAINPELRITRYRAGVTNDCIDAFLDGVDLFIDGLDFFALDRRSEIFARCTARGIPAITAAPIGLGTAFLIFVPGSMTFEEYFQLEGLSGDEKAINFLVGLTPRTFQRAALVDFSRVNLSDQRGPSTVIACQLCAGVAAAEAMKLLLNRGPVRAAPRYHQFDPYAGKWTIGWLPGGNRNPIQRLRKRIARSLVQRLSCNPRPDEPRAAGAPVLEKILQMARWAPSGDNLQPWRFELTSHAEGAEALSIHIAPHKPGDVYDYNDGEPTLLSVGTLVESIRLAASQYRRRVAWEWSPTDTGGIVQVQLYADPQITKDSLSDELKTRSVDRRRFRATALSSSDKRRLSDALGPEFRITWFDGLRDRWGIAKLNAHATKIRLGISEAFEIHQRIIDWNRDFSPSGVPARAVGLAPPSVALMRLTMRNWRRMRFVNRYLGGSYLARFELDVLPGLCCGAHFAVTSALSPANSMDRRQPSALLRAGAAIQRFWLTATQLGLALQPSLATLCFAHYGRHKFPFTADVRFLSEASKLAAKFDTIVGERCGDTPVFLGRIGIPQSQRIHARSVRLPFSHLLHSPEQLVEEQPG